MKRNREYDKNILNAIYKLNWPIENCKGKLVYIRKNARNENGFEHIAEKHHLLKVRDIELIPSILKKPFKIISKKRNRKGISYFGKRKATEKNTFLKIVTKCRKDGCEEIVTIYTTKWIK